MLKSSRSMKSGIVVFIQVDSENKLSRTPCATNCIHPHAEIISNLSVRFSGPEMQVEYSLLQWGYFLIFQQIFLQVIEKHQSFRAIVLLRSEAF